jgi:hypothetical protein
MMPVPPKSTIYDAIYPQQYIAYRAPIRSDNDGGSTSSCPPPLAIDIDGNLDKPFWSEVPWTQDFVDIATDTVPKFRTRVKMRWDDDFLYVGEFWYDQSIRQIDF